jgi:competence protein ComGC
MERKRPNQELLRFLNSVRDKAADQKDVLFGPVIAIPPAIFLAYFGNDMDLGLAILLSIVIAIGSWLLLVVILSIAKQRSTINNNYAAFTLAVMLLVFFVLSAFKNDRVIQNLGAANTAQVEALTSQAESLRYARITQTAVAKSLINAESTQASAEGMLADISSTQIAQGVALADMQATIVYQADLLVSINSTPTPSALEEEMKIVIRSYFELLSNNDIDTAWNTYLTGDLQQGVVDQYTRESYERYWETREIEIDEFLSFDFNFDKTEGTVRLKVFYYIDDSPKGYVDTIWLIMNEEQQRWLINRFVEEEVS